MPVIASKGLQSWVNDNECGCSSGISTLDSACSGQPEWKPIKQQFFWTVLCHQLEVHWLGDSWLAVQDYLLIINELEMLRYTEGTWALKTDVDFAYNQLKWGSYNHLLRSWLLTYFSFTLPWVVSHGRPKGLFKFRLSFVNIKWHFST